MSTKKSLETCTIQGKEAVIGTIVAYPKSDYSGYHTKIHVGTIKRITDQGVWIEPNEEYADDKCGKTIVITNGEPQYIRENQNWYSRYMYNPNYKVLGKNKSLVHDWIWKEFDRCLVL